MTKTGVLVQNWSIFKANFGVRCLFVKHIEKDLVEYLYDVSMTHSQVFILDYCTADCFRLP
jgi:hypothetical protein